ncbi:MAG: hypothetical protein KDA61_11475 [Planctomycetales bacterium]|nr:hypothetical protein [Planctomycetales bacterium]
MHMPHLNHPGPAPYQRGNAIEFDPYPQNDVGPEIVGGRPREYDKPLDEVRRARQHDPYLPSPPPAPPIISGGAVVDPGGVTFGPPIVQGPTSGAPVVSPGVPATLPPTYGYGTPSYGVAPNYGTTTIPGAGPPYGVQPSYGGVPAYGSGPGYGAAPTYSAPPATNVAPSYGGGQAYGAPNYGGSPAFQTPPAYGSPSAPPTYNSTPLY